MPDAIEEFLEELWGIGTDILTRSSVRYITLLTDTDADVLSDVTEAIIGSIPVNPNSPVMNGFDDSDTDGVADSVEYYLESVLGLPEVDQQTDGDGDTLPDVLEVEIGTRPDNGDDPVVDGGGDDDGDGISNALEWYTDGVIENSTLSFTETTLTANATDTTEARVVVQNAAGQPIADATVTFTLLGVGDATVSNVVNNGDGSYTATITAGVRSGTLTVETTVFDGLVTFALPAADIQLLSAQPPRSGGGDASVLLLLLLAMWLLAGRREYLRGCCR